MTAPPGGRPSSKRPPPPSPSPAVTTHTRRAVNGSSYWHMPVTWRLMLKSCHRPPTFGFGPVTTWAKHTCQRQQRRESWPLTRILSFSSIIFRLSSAIRRRLSRRACLSR
jgi:hypothetical protein